MKRSAGQPAASRKDQRSGRLLMAIGLLILLGMSPIMGHHLAGDLDRLLVGTDHIGAVCLIALHALLGPVHDLFHLLLAVGLGYALWDRVQAFRVLRRTLAGVAWESPAPRGPIAGAARAAGLDPANVRIARGLPVPAFTAGWIRPRIYLAQELEEHLSADELTAVVAHEGAHAARRDPLTLSLLRFIGHTLFWIPVLRRLAEDCADEAEIRADDAARRGRPLTLASAILAVAEWGPPLSRRIGVGLHHPDLLERRVRRLAGDDAPARSHVTRRSVLGAVGMLLLVWITGMVMAHPLPDPHTAAAHCDHEDRPAWAHLLCARPQPAHTSAICPHG